jgi:hypothetical protein
VQSAVAGSGTAATSGSVTLGAFADTKNGTYAAIGLQANETVTPGTGFTILEQAANAEPLTIATELQTTPNTTPGATWASAPWGVTGVELAAAVSTVLTETDDPYGAAVLADSPVAYLRMDETSGTTVADQTGNGNTGTLMNTPTLGEPPGIGTGHSIKFTKASSEIMTLNDAASLHLNDVFTYECWVKFNTFDTHNVDLYGQTAANSALLRVTFDTRVLTLRVNSVADVCASTIALTTGSWYHLAVTKNGSAVHLYINGVDRTGTVTNQTITTASAVTHAWGTGGIGDANSLDGWLDEIAMYNYALTSAQVAAHYAAGIA